MAVFAKYNLPHLHYNKCIYLFFKNLLIHLFVAVLGLHCCAEAFSSCSEQGLLSSFGVGTSHCCGAWAMQCVGSTHRLSS